MKWRDELPDPRPSDLKAYAGSAPVTRESGRSRHVTHRRIKNSRPAATGRPWAFAALTASPGAHAHCNRRRSNGDRYHALRNLFNRMLGQLHHCLARHEKFDETIAFHQPTSSPLTAAARPGSSMACLVGQDRIWRRGGGRRSVGTSPNGRGPSGRAPAACW